MRVVFRADSSFIMGSGHIMRCLTLAAELTRSGAQVEFISRQAPGDHIDFIRKERGYVTHQLPQDCSPLTDAILCSGLLEAGEKPDWLIVDHYDLDAKWHRRLRAHVGRILVIDDLANRPHDCDMLLDQNLQDTDTLYDGLVPQECIKLLGPKYALLRPEFATMRATKRRRTGTIERILISFGGSDPTGETTKVLTQLRDSQYANRFQIDCVVGNSHTRLADLSALIETMPNVHLHVQTERMAQLMTTADLSFGAGGSTTWERCCLGLPTVAVAVSAHQVPFCRRLEREGYCYYAGSSQAQAVNYIAALHKATLDPEARRTMSLKGMELVDGRGTERVATQMMELD